MIRILLVDDQNLVQQGIKSLLDRDPEVEVIGTIKDGRSAVMQIKKLHPDIVLLDIEMPGMDGITATKYITHLAPQTKVIILSSHEDKKYLTQALMAGAKAYILKNSLMADLKQSIIAVNNGYSHIESRLLAKIFDPSNLKSSNSKKTPSQDSKPSRVVTRKPVAKTRTTEQLDNLASRSAPMFRDRAAEVSFADGSDRTWSTVSTIDPSDSKVVPKINLPYSDSASQLSTTVENHDRQTLMVTLKGKNDDQQTVERPKIAKYKTELIQWTAKKAQYKPLIELSQSQLAEYLARIMPVLKQWHKKGWLANFSLVFLGLVTVIIIHLMFS